MRWGLALSGGIAYGLANAGVVTELHRQNLQPDSIAGSSMGAIVGALYALRGSADAIEDLCNGLNVLKLAKFSTSPFKDGLSGGIFRQNLEDLLASVLGEATINDCRIPFTCIAGRMTEPVDWARIVLPGFTDYYLERVKPVVLPPETPLLDAIMASSAMPVLFSPVEIGGYPHIDLLKFGSVPARALRTAAQPDVVVGTDTNPPDGVMARFLPPGWSEFLQRGQKEIDADIAACDLVIHPDMIAAPFRFDKAKEFLKAGEEATSEALPEILRVTQMS